MAAATDGLRLSLFVRLSQGCAKSGSEVARWLSLYISVIQAERRGAYLSVCSISFLIFLGAFIEARGEKEEWHKGASNYVSSV